MTSQEEEIKQLKQENTKLKEQFKTLKLCYTTFNHLKCLFF